MTLDPSATAKRDLTSFQPLAGEPNPFGEHPRCGPYQAEIPLTAFRSEREMADRVLARLEPWFYVQREVAGKHCSGRRLRVDAIIRPRQADQWCNPAVAFGVEFKFIPNGAGINAYTGWIAQAVSYSHVDWPDYGRLIILTCPGAASWLSTGTANDSHGVMVARRLAGQLNVGELVLRRTYGLTLLVNGEHIWSERYGVVRGRHWRLVPKSGNITGSRR